MTLKGLQCLSKYLLNPDIPKFDRNLREKPTTQLIIYHLECLSNSLVHDSIKLCLFQWTMIEDVTKFYINLKKAPYHDYDFLVWTFLNHLYLPSWHYIRTNLLFTLKQDTFTHISSNIHEWKWCKWLIRTKIPNWLVKYWFTRSFIL